MADRAPGEGLDAAGTAGRGGFDPRASAGLFVGVSTFEDDRIVEVPFAVDDAVDLAHLFALELGLVAPGRTVLLLAGEPRKTESVARLEALRQSGAQVASARQRDIYRHLAGLAENVRLGGGMALLSVATHGVTDAGGDFLVATDSLADRKLRTGVAVAEVFEEASRAGRGLVLLDACREQVLRARGEGAGAAMGQGFAEAIAKARGLVVLSGATLGGFAYDDPKRGNGVFTAAVLDGLHGGAAAGPGGWITVRTLADFVQERVVAWIRKEWPREEERSRGIGRRIEASAEDLPLAPHPSATRERERYRERRKKALDRVHELQKGEVLSGAHWDQVRALLPAEEPNVEAEKLLEEIEALDGGVRSQRGLRDYLREVAGGLVAVNPLPKPEVPRPAELRPQSPRPLVSPPPARKLPEPVPKQPSVAVAEKKKLRWGKNWTRAAIAAAGVILALVVLWAVFGKREQIEPAESTVMVSDNTSSEAPGIQSEEEPAAVSLPLTSEVNTLGMNFLYVPSGAYTIGSPKGVGDDDERPHHEVTLTRGFWLGETEVTQAQWTQLVPKGAPWRSKTCGSDCPVEGVSWYAAAMVANLLSDKEDLARCYSLDSARCKGTLGGDYTCPDPPLPDLDCPGYRLPTEAEWEVAARAGQATAEPSDLDPVAWFAPNSGGTVHPVGKKQANAWGFHDLLGNVYEWTGDWKGDYSTERVVNPQGSPQGPNRVVRGGSWFTFARYVRAASRYWNLPGDRRDFLGFRLARGQGLRSGTGR